MRSRGLGQGGFALLALTVLLCVALAPGAADANPSVFPWDKPEFLFPNATIPGPNATMGMANATPPPSPANASGPRNATGPANASAVAANATPPGPANATAQEPEEPEPPSIHLFGKVLELGMAVGEVYDRLEDVEGIAEMKPAACSGEGGETERRLRRLHQQDPVYRRRSFRRFAAERTLFDDPFPCGNASTQGPFRLSLVREERTGPCLIAARAEFFFRDGRLESAQVERSAQESCEAVVLRRFSDLEAELRARYGSPEQTGRVERLIRRCWEFRGVRIWLIRREANRGAQAVQAWEMLPSFK
jgi:hypothetical protein